MHDFIQSYVLYIVRVHIDHHFVNTFFLIVSQEFLASLGIIHRDLACCNILVGDEKQLKISNFGMSQTLTDNDSYVKNTRDRLPWKWMAIESLCNREFTSASDVWVYGVTLWEISTLGNGLYYQIKLYITFDFLYNYLGGSPYPSIPNSEIMEYIQSGQRLKKPENCSKDV